MSFMFEVYYRAPTDNEREARITAEVKAAGGWFNYRELPTEHSQAIVLTFEFNNRVVAGKLADSLRARGEHVEGPANYEPD
jgi:hypothetical protein